MFNGFSDVTVMDPGIGIVRVNQRSKRSSGSFKPIR